MPFGPIFHGHGDFSLGAFFGQIKISIDDSNAQITRRSRLAIFLLRKNKVTVCEGQVDLFDMCYYKAVLKRINTLIKDIQREPFEGIGKPEPLKHSLSGYWSRRINEEHRIVYKVSEETLFIAQLRYHYEY